MIDINDDLQYESSELEKIENVLFEKYMQNIEEEETEAAKKKIMKKIKKSQKS